MKHSILIVDDEQTIRESLHLLLQGEGFDSECAKDGREALNLALDRKFDLIILDLHLPKINGLDVLKQVKEHCPDTIVLIVTSYYDLEIAAEALLLGASRMILKPIDFEELLDIIANLLNGR